MLAESYAPTMDAFDQLQAGLADVWPAMTLRTTEPSLRTIIMVHSLPSEFVPASLAPVFPAYEERFLAVVLSLLRSPGSRLVYVTSQPIHPRIVDYWFRLVPGIDVQEARSRLFLVSPVDGSPRPLVDKLLDRPRLLARIRRLVVDPRLAVIVPFACGGQEARLAVELGIPVYGSHPRLWSLGGKSAARRIFREAGVQVARGAEALHSRTELRAALQDLVGEVPGLARAMVKLDQGVSGYGNATIRLVAPDGTPLEVDRAIDAMEFEDAALTLDDFLQMLNDGAALEEFLIGDQVRSPSVQMRNSPMGEVEVLSTHDQVLGGPNGLSFLGCRFPADLEYGPQLAVQACQIGRHLADKGVVGRYAIDFVTVRDGSDPWRSYAVEVNLRCGGTTHTFMALQTLTDGVFDAKRGTFTDQQGRPKFYVASDHLEAPPFSQLTPDDLFDILDERHLGWDERTMTGIAVHMASAIAVAGRVGATAIAATPSHADALLDAIRHALVAETT